MKLSTFRLLVPRIAATAAWPLRHRLPWLACLLALLPPAAVGAESTVAQKDTPREAARESMPLKIANRTVISLRGPIAGYSAQERVVGATARIEAALTADGAAAVTTEANEDGTRVLIGGKLAFLVTRADVDAYVGETTQNVAREAAKRLETAIVEYREQRTPSYFALHLAYAAVATLLYSAILWLIYRVNGWSSGRLAQAAAARAGKLNLSGVSIFDTSYVLLFVRRLITIVAWLVALVLTSAWLTLVLDQFPYTRPWAEQLEGNLLGVIKEITLAIVGALPGLVFVVVIILMARGISRFSHVFFDRVQQGRLEVGWIDTDTARPTRKIFDVVIWLFALAMAYPYLPGAQTEAFKGVSVLAGLMVTLGASSVIGQAFSGLILMFNRSYRAGDYVRIGETEGTVAALGTFTTRIRTGLGEEITLPNSVVMASAVKNYSRAVPGTGYVVDTVVTIGYSTPWRQVHAMLEEAARRTADIASAPAAMVRQTALSDYYVEYRLVAYTPVTSPAQRIDVLNRLHGNIQDVFNEHGVQIMSPHYMADPAEPQVVPKKNWYLAPARPPQAGEK